VVDVENRYNSFQGIVFKFATCCKSKGVFKEVDLVGSTCSLIGASRERAHLRSAISQTTANATVERWATFSQLRNMLRQARAHESILCDEDFLGFFSECQ
jgi:hypothetical protein